MPGFGFGKGQFGQTQDFPIIPIATRGPDCKGSTRQVSWPDNHTMLRKEKDNMSARVPGKMNLVTIFYRDDMSMMRLQARSLDRHVNPDQIDRILLIYNDDPESFDQVAWQELKDLYGSHSAGIHLVDQRSFDIPPGTGISGWSLQQVLKLQSFKFCTSEEIVILDSKNHFIRPVDRNTFFSKDGRPKNFFSLKFGQQKSWLRSSLAYFGNDPSISELEVPPTITPYAILSSTLADMCQEIERREESVFRLFSRPDFGGTEFYLILSFLLSKNAQKDFSFFDAGETPATVFATWPTSPEDMDRVLRRAEAKETSSFGLHSRRNRRLTAGEWARIQEIWRSAGIYDETASRFYESRILEPT
jgi:hypothetical protein